jgi:hypothetical protein
MWYLKKLEGSLRLKWFKNRIIQKKMRFELRIEEEDDSEESTKSDEEVE